MIMESGSGTYKTKESFDFFCDQISAYYQPKEILSMIYMLFEEYLQMKKTDILLYPDRVISGSQLNNISRAIDDLKDYKPLQYIIGKANFFGMDFFVSPDVLIPRPETEELVQWVIDDNESFNSGDEARELNVLDIGSSSGCISISLKKNIHSSKVSGIDINDAALSIARRNNELNNTDVDFFHFDIFNEKAWDQFPKYDIIVSNPPYIRESERQQMSRNVLDYEPSQALFVSDDDPLIFYNTIIKFSQSHLKPSGKIYFEINEAFGEKMIRLLEDNGFLGIVLKKDVNGRDRMIRGGKLAVE